MREVAVSLGLNGYTIQIGENLTESIQKFVKTAGFSKNALIITDANIDSLYGEALSATLATVGLQAKRYVVAAGENTKSLTTAEQIYTKAIELGLDRHSAIFALGGGVIGDLAGFIAATYLRGIPFVQIPTSLLAQVDSSVGGKVAVNHPLGKNLIGAFYQPKAVFIDLSCLHTLPKREIYTGLAEIIKYGIIYDRTFFDYLQSHADDIIALKQEAMLEIIAHSCEIKAAVVSQDERETGLRIILNFGHTIAHAIESETGYTSYNHGEAVAIGMHGALLLSSYLNLISEDDLQSSIALIKKFQLPTKASGCMPEALYKALFRDKKTVGGTINWVLTTGIGSTKIDKQVSPSLVKQVLNEITVC